MRSCICLTFDRVAVANNPQTRLDGTVRTVEWDMILNILQRLRSGGSTSGAEAAQQRVANGCASRVREEKVSRERNTWARIAGMRSLEFLSVF